VISSLCQIHPFSTSHSSESTLSQSTRFAFDRVISRDCARYTLGLAIYGHSPLHKLKFKPGEASLPLNNHSLPPTAPSYTTALYTSEQPSHLAQGPAQLHFHLALLIAPPVPEYALAPWVFCQSRDGTLRSIDFLNLRHHGG
jgi:hypothetical protein